MITFLIILAVFIFLWKLTPNPANKKAIGMFFQMLESFHIIDTTVKFNTFEQRLDFIGKLANTLPANVDKNKCIDTALQSYSQKYSDNPISPTIKAILNNPQIASSPKFRDEATTAFYLRSCSRLNLEIEQLKTTAAKRRRIQQAAELSEIVKERLCSAEKAKYIIAINESYENLTALHTL